MPRAGEGQGEGGEISAAFRVLSKACGAEYFPLALAGRRLGQRRFAPPGGDLQRRGSRGRRDLIAAEPVMAVGRPWASPGADGELAARDLTEVFAMAEAGERIDKETIA